MCKISKSSSRSTFTLHLLLGSLILWALPLNSQESNNSGGSAGGGQFESNTLLQILNQVYDPDEVEANLEDGRFNWRGNTFDIGNFRAIRGRFNRYLNTPVNPLEQEEYLSLLSGVLQKLSVANQRDINPQEPWANVIEAWEMLFDAASHPMDAGSSEVIANTIYNFWRTRDEFNSRNFWSAVDRAEQRRMENRAVRTVQGERLALRQEMERMSRSRSPSLDSLQSESAPLSEFTPSGVEARDAAEMRALVEAEDAATAAMGIQAKLSMQSAMVSFLAERRFQHALIAAQFYRHLFRGSEQDLLVGKDTLARIVSDADFTPTVDLLEFMARQASDDVKQSMSSIYRAIDEGQYVSALERLQETFLIGEHTPEMMGFSVEHRRTLRTLMQRLRELERLAELRDYAEALELGRRIADIAEDFPFSEVNAAVRAAKSASNLAVFAARAAMLERDSATARDQLALATELWPLNPEIQNLMESASSQSDVSVQGIALFEDALSRNEYRRIFNRRGELTVALMREEEKLRQLQEIVEQIARIDMIVEQAEELLAQNNPHGAWELLLQSGPIGEDDPVLNRAKANLAPAVARFIGLLDMAHRAEERNEPAVALIHFLRAREIYPASREVRLGLERTSRATMQQIPSATEVTQF